MQQHCTAVAGRSSVRPPTTFSTLWAYCPSVSQCCHHVPPFLLHIKLHSTCDILQEWLHAHVQSRYPSPKLRSGCFCFEPSGKKRGKKAASCSRSGKEVAQAKEEEEGSTEQQQLKYGIPSLRSGCMTGTGHIVAVRNIFECKWQRGEMTTERLRDRGQRPKSVSAQEERLQSPCITALLFLSFLNLLLNVFFPYMQICSHLTSLGQSSGHLTERMVKLVCTCPKLV